MKDLKEIPRNLVTAKLLTTSQSTKPDPIQAAFDDNAPDTLSTLPDRINTKIAVLPDAESEPRNVTKIIPPVLNEVKKLHKKNSSRITIIANKTSWIQLRDTTTNQMILSKVLNKDQRYQVPDKPGLSLMTGNAGALEITVDGIIVPKIGKLGEVRRKILMEVKSLKSGQAVIE